MTSLQYIERFVYKLLDASVHTVYDEAIYEWVDMNIRKTGRTYCICGHGIKEQCIVLNRLNKNQLVVGNCCIRKFGIKHIRKGTKADYFENALLNCRSGWETKFVSDLFLKAKAYTNLRLSEKQKSILERIAGRPYKFRLFER